MRSHRSFVLSVAVAAFITLLAVACSGKYSESNPAGPSAVGGAAVGGGPVSLKAANVDVCHTTGNGSFQLLNINGNALSAHLNHGDAQPGDVVPGDPTKQFDDACTQVDVSTGAECPCATSFASAVNQWVSTFGGLDGTLDHQVPESIQCTQEIGDSHIDVSVAFFPDDPTDDRACVTQFQLLGVDIPDFIAPITTEAEFNACAEIVQATCEL